MSLIVLLGCLGAAASAAAATPEPRDAIAAISGTLTKADGAAAAGVEISVYRNDGAGRQKVAAAVSAADGSYTVGLLPAGTYWLGFFDPSGALVPEFYDNKPTLGTANAVTVAEEQLVTGINARLAAYGSLGGQVKNAAGKVIADLEVGAYVFDGVDGWQWAGGGHTGADGKYTIGGLLPGAYRVGFADPAGTYLGEYFNDRHSLPRAADIVVQSGRLTVNVNAALDLPGGILGTVTNESGAGIAGIQVDVYHQDGGHWDVVGSTVTQGSGAYVVEDLPAGNCRVRFRDPGGTYLTRYYNARQTLSSADDVSVAAGKATAGIDVKLVAAARIKGKVTKPGGAALLGIKVYVMRRSGSGWKTVGKAVSSATGTYSIGRLAPSTYRVKFVDTVGVYVTEYFDNQLLPAKATAVALSAGQVRRADARLALAGRISGTITNRAGRALEKITVTAFRRDGESWVWAAAVRSGPTGAYRLVGLPAGTYRARFSDPAGTYATLYFRSATTLQTAADVSVTAGHTTTRVSAQLVKRPAD